MMYKELILCVAIFSVVWCVAIADDDEASDVSSLSPRKCDYCEIKGSGGKPNTYCAYANSKKPRCSSFSHGLTRAEKQNILDIHNGFRSKVALGKEPQLRGKQAADMHELTWSRELAKGAQLWANQCKFEHDSAKSCKYNWIGQNLYISGFRGTPSDPKGNWNDAGDSWYSEVKKFRGNTDSFVFSSGTGHFTQVIWAKTKEIGCGYVSHKGYNGGNQYNSRYYVCNYGPGGNVRGSPIFITGKPCSKCPSGTKCRNGLCSKGSNSNAVSQPGNNKPTKPTKPTKPATKPPTKPTFNQCVNKCVKQCRQQGYTDYHYGY